MARNSRSSGSVAQGLEVRFQLLDQAKDDRRIVGKRRAGIPQPVEKSIHVYADAIPVLERLLDQGDELIVRLRRAIGLVAGRPDLWPDGDRVGNGEGRQDQPYRQPGGCQHAAGDSPLAGDDRQAAIQKQAAEKPGGQGRPGAPRCRSADSSGRTRC